MCVCATDILLLLVLVLLLALSLQVALTGRLATCTSMKLCQPQAEYYSTRVPLSGDDFNLKLLLVSLTRTRSHPVFNFQEREWQN